MARYKGGLFTSVLDTNKRFPLDARMLVSKKEDLINPEIWNVNTLGTDSMYNGMIVSVGSKETDGTQTGLYQLIDRHAITLELFVEYKAAVANEEPTEKFFFMWKKIANEEDVDNLKDLVGQEAVATQIQTAIQNSGFLKREAAEASYTKVPYEISHKPKGVQVDLREKELRVMCPKNTKWTLQQSASHADPFVYYIGFKAYAPFDNVEYFREDLKLEIEDNRMYSFDNNDYAGIDEYGRKYSIIWLPAARYNGTDGTWKYYGASSRDGKYIGWDYSVEWYDKEGVQVASDKIRINLTNEKCQHTRGVNVRDLIQDEGDVLYLNGGIVK